METRRDVTPEASVIADFAITTVNVPDRLDAQEVRDRAEADSDHPERRFRSSWPLRRIGFGLAALAVFASIAFAAFSWVSPLWTRISAEGIAAELTTALGRPVRVASAGLRLAPSPRLVVEGIEVDNAFRVGAVALRFSWASLARVVQGSGWAWGEATVGPLELTPESAFALLGLAPSWSRVVPAPIRTIVFESVQFRGGDLLPGRYVVSASRSDAGTFRDFVLNDLGVPARIELVVNLLTPETPKFRLRAYQWRPPVGPSVEWSEVSAEGLFDPSRLQVDTLSANGFLGVVTGTLLARRAKEWSVRGSFQTANIDLAAVQRELRRRAKLPGDVKSGPIVQGVMDSTGVMSGQGATLTDALDRLAATGKVRIRFAALNGMNLGLIAVQSSSAAGAGGVTRFADFEATVDAASGSVRVRDIVASAGALKVAGSVGVDRELGLGGVLRAEVLSSGAIVASDVRLAGTVLEPLFE